jgi:hypothetical protein
MVNLMDALVTKIAILIIMALPGCGAEDRWTAEDSTLAALTAEFQYECETRNLRCNFNNLHVKWEPELPGTVLGQCHRQFTKKLRLELTISVSPIDQHGLQLTDDELKLVVFHELGHCVLNLPHVEEDYELMSKYATKSNELPLHGGLDGLLERFWKGLEKTQQTVTQSSTMEG